MAENQISDNLKPVGQRAGKGSALYSGMIPKLPNDTNIGKKTNMFEIDKPNMPNPKIPEPTPIQPVLVEKKAIETPNPK